MRNHRVDEFHTSALEIRVISVEYKLKRVAVSVAVFPANSEDPNIKRFPGENMLLNSP